MENISDLTSNERGIVFYAIYEPILENEKQIGQNCHRVSLVPGSDLSGQPKNVVDFCNSVWTEQIVTNYRMSY